MDLYIFMGQVAKLSLFTSMKSINTRIIVKKTLEKYKNEVQNLTNAKCIATIQ